LALAAALTTALANVAFAGSVRRTGMDFLNIPAGARPAALGSAYTALANDTLSLAWNPAGLASLPGREISAMRSQWILGSQYSFLGYGIPSRTGALAGSIAVLSQGEAEARGEDRQKIGTVKAQDRALSLGYGKKLGRWRAGVSAKLLKSALAGYKASGFALDGGLLYPASPSITIGFSIMNLGPGMKFLEQRDPLPLSLAAGAAWKLPGLGLSVALDLKHQPYDRKTTLSAGTEYRLAGALSLRAGYLSHLAAPASLRAHSAFAGLGAGFGVLLGGYQFDYALVPFGPLGDAHRLSLAMRW